MNRYSWLILSIFVTGICVSMLQMFIDWNEDNLHYIPNPKLYDCLLSARSPAPSSVRNLTIVGHSLVGNQQISLTLHWLPPAQPNGDLIDYNVCIGPYVLNVGLQELPVTPHSCRRVEVRDWLKTFCSLIRILCMIEC